jgi:DNA-binding MarR family transcriptional regulator
MSHLLESELTPRQFAVLEAVAQNDGLSQTDIMHATGIDRSSTAELVRRLVKAGYLQRRRKRRDARAYSVKITTSGRRLRALGIPAARAVQEELLAALTVNERGAFLGMLARVAVEAKHEC